MNLFGKHVIGLIALLLMSQSCTSETTSESVSNEARWFKGNLHTHSLWSDGDDYPESIIAWYKNEGYNFLAISDHNVLAQGERWIPVEQNAGGRLAFNAYLEAFGDEWVDQKTENDTDWVRLKTYDEYRSLFEEESQFLMIQSEEITDGFEGKPIHVNATNIAEFIAPQGGTSVRDVMQNNVDAVLAQRQNLDIPMFPHINHPNFGWAITAEDLLALEGEQFFEVYNGHPLVRNYGDAARPGMEMMWDIILTRRLMYGQPIMFGIAVDDSHNYHEHGTSHSNTGRAWVMVRAEDLTPEAIVTSMERGDFYGSTGVVLDDLILDTNKIQLKIVGKGGVTYRTEFRGTRVNHDSTSMPVEVDGAAVTRRYSDEIGEVLAIVEGLEPVYQFEGNEMYVRAKVISSEPKENPYEEGEFEMAWTQPVIIEQ